MLSCGAIMSFSQRLILMNMSASVALQQTRSELMSRFPVKIKGHVDDKVLVSHLRPSQVSPSHASARPVVIWKAYAATWGLGDI